MQPVVDHNTTAQGQLIKKDRITGAPLFNAVYRFSTCEQSSVEEFTVTTGETGSAGMEFMPMGCHMAVELKAPDGYLLDPTPIYFEVQAGQRFTVNALDTTIDQQPVARNVGNRTPLQSIPSGPVRHP